MGELLPARDARRHGADRGDAARRLQRAAESGQPVLLTDGRHQRSADRPAVPRQRHPGQPPVAERRGDHEPVSAADARLPAGHAEPAPDQRQHAGSAQGQHPARLPAERVQQSGLPLLAIVVHRPEPVRRRLPAGAPDHRPAELHVVGDLDQHHQEQPDQRAHLHVLARRRLHRRLHRDRASISAAGPASTTPTSSRATRRSRTRSRRSPASGRSTASTAAPIRRRRPGRSTRSATSPRWSAAGTRSRPV